MSALDTQIGGGHYKDMAIQPVEYIHANGIPFIEGCVIKYVSRWKSKGGIADLEKARHFIDLLVEMERKAAAPKLIKAPGPTGVSAQPGWSSFHNIPVYFGKFQEPNAIVRLTPAQVAQMEEACAASDRLTLPVRGEVG